MNNNFQLIGIKILDNCGIKLSKILQKNITYHFYGNYRVDDTTENIAENYILPEFYNSKDLQINISAIVGKNGSGKSTIVELLFMILNNISAKTYDAGNQLKIITELHAVLYFKTDFIYKVIVESSDISFYKFNPEKGFGNSPIKNFDFTNFFYTIVINYSQYALNSNEIGEWINGLFHKNDGYQIPVVINPMRDEGNFNINVENSLVKARLMTNLAKPVVKSALNFRKLTDHTEADGVRLRIYKGKRITKSLYNITELKEVKGKKERTTVPVRFVDLNIDVNDILEKINSIYDFDLARILSNGGAPRDISTKYGLDNEFHTLALDYLCYKLVSISLKYKRYLQYFDTENKNFYPKTLLQYIGELLEQDSSHVTFKIKQTLNFLKFGHIEPKVQYISFNKLSKKIQSLMTDTNNNLSELNRIELLPPPIFDIEIILKQLTNGTHKSRLIDFSLLSSGEKQLIYSVSSILYHLINLDSVSYGVSYSRVNIILDEIEMYFHPDFQKRYIKHVIDSIKMFSFENIRCLNICCITHSPFILSDIPHTNAMFLNVRESDVNYSEQCEDFGATFCANIHDLLAHNFFLGRGFMGDFATDAVRKAVEDLEQIDKKNKGLPYKLVSDDRLSDIRELISLVSEPLLRHNLEEMFSSITSFETPNEKVLRLRKELQEAESKFKDNDKNI